MKFLLSFGCFLKNHIVTDCKNICTCKICQHQHPTSLHGYIPRSNVQPKTNSTVSDNPCSNPSVTPHVASQIVPITSALVSGETAVSMCIVPVVLTHSSSKREVKTFALLDAYSQGSFIDNALLETFCSDFVETNIH